MQLIVAGGYKPVYKIDYLDKLRWCPQCIPNHRSDTSCLIRKCHSGLSYQYMSLRENKTTNIFVSNHIFL